MRRMLEVRGISVSYDGVLALRDVSLSVAEGAIVSLIGSNGAGKTTTLKAIIGLKSVTAGEIRLDGERLDMLSAPQRVGRGIALSPEGRRVFAQMSVADNLLVGAYLHGNTAQTRRTLEDIYRYFPRLVERRSQIAGSLSGGEQQMLAIGRALMARPRLLLLDEPSLGLAPIVVEEIARIISDINRDTRMSIILVEQNAKLALSLCNQAFVLETGSIALSGAGKELLASDYVRRAYLGI
ncbi:MAG: ABC transporter ATP-binding protein [Bradyrhizobium sp.]